ncbi:MAG: hypothetical protein O3A00_11550 [Planctomycetota bacterium]|nr:hypothetical protein [Planctomycetota bacterium]
MNVTAFVALIMVVLVIAAIVGGLTRTTTARGVSAAAALLAASLVFMHNLRDNGRNGPASRDVSPRSATKLARDTTRDIQKTTVGPTANQHGDQATQLSASSAVLEESSDDPPPAWLENRRYVIDNTTLVVLSSQRWSTTEEAEQDANRLLVETLKADLRDHDAQAATNWRLDPAQAAVAVRNSYRQSYRQDLGAYIARMHRVHLQVELSPSVRSKLIPIWREQVVDQRLWELGGLLGVATLILGIAAIGLRIAPVLNGVQRVGMVAGSLLATAIGSYGIIGFTDGDAGAEVSHVSEKPEDTSSETVPPDSGIPGSLPKIIPHRSAEFFGIRDAGRRIAFVFEATDSMKSSGGLDRVRNELKTWLDQTDPNTEFILVAHSATVVASPLTHEHAGALEFVRSLVPSVAADGGPFLDAMSRASLVRPDCIYVVTDDAEPTLLQFQIANIAKAVPSNVRIHCIELAADADSSPSAGIKALSDRFRGVCKRIEQSAPTEPASESNSSAEELPELEAAP